MFTFFNEEFTVKYCNSIGNYFCKLAYIFFIISLSFSTLNAAYFYVDNDDRDAEERISDGDMSRGSNDLEMAYDPLDRPDRGLQIIGLRFNDVTIPVGSTINSAKIRFRSDNDDSGATSLIIYGELANDADGFSRDDHDLSDRTPTTATVSWSPGAWSNNNYYETVDISTIIQEIVNQAGYAGDDLVIMIKPGAGCTDSDCRRRADSRDETSSSAPRLEIDYSDPPPSCSNIKDSDNLTGSHTSYTNSAHYNSSSWNVGPSATATSRAYYFTVDSAGTVDIDLSRIDNEQARFSVSPSSCPTTFDNLKSTQISFSGAGDFYVYIYYINGDHSNIEHQLDVVFTPSVAPAIVSDSFSISENASIGDLIGTLVSTGGPTSYTINSGADGKFIIDDNGLINTSAILDYETVTSYTLSVTATNAIGSDTKDIIINLIDEDAPTALSQTFYVDETAVNDTLIGTIVATGNPNVFTINSGNTGDTFKIDSSGNIQVNDNSNLDATTTPQYILLVTLSSPEGSVTINVTINVDSTLSSSDDNRRDFTNVSLLGNDSISINGNILLIGNQLLCQNSSNEAECTEPTVGVQNNSINQHKARIDFSTGSPDNNTWAKLTLEDGTGTLSEADEVIFARLYWSARIAESTVDEDEKNEARTIQIKGPKSSTYTTLTSSVSRFNWFHGSLGFDYAASQDVTEYVKSNGAGNYSVGGISASNGENRFASWALIVVVQNSKRDLNNISIYDGFQSIYSGRGYPDDVTVPASGFLTPLGTEPFGASLFVYTGESEDDLPDSAQIQNASGDWNKLTDGYNNVNEVFNASIYTPENGFRSDHDGEANPNFQNVIGTDIDKLEINRAGDPSKQYLSNSQTSTNIKISSGGDQYTLNLFAFETELHYPKMCYDYSYSQDGYIYTELNDGTQTPYINIATNSGNPVTVTIYVRSEDNDVNFDHISLYSDMNLSAVSYAGDFQRTTINAFGYNSVESEYLSSNCQETSNPTNKICKTGSGNFRVGIGRPDPVTDVLGYPISEAGNMQSSDFMYFKYNLEVNGTSALNTPLKLFADIQYSLTTGGASVDPVTDLPFGGDRMPLCPPSTTYIPEWGMFNVIDTELNSAKTGESGSRFLNNLLTQVSERPFGVDVVAYDPTSNPPNTPQDINTSVAIELVDIKGFHDVNISCKEPAVSFSDRVYLNFAEENRKVVNGLQTPYAKEDVAYRIWYIHDGNVGNIITDWAATTEPGTGELTGIDNLYEQIPDAPDVCWYDCDGAQSPAKTRDAECYECLRTHFGYPLCSRDNFAIRPESYHISLKDSNATTSKHLLNNSSSGTANLASGYSYKLDINSTNHVDSDNTIGYNKQFIEDDVSYLNLEFTNPALVCNNESNNSLTPLIGNGGTTDFQFSNTEIGNYTMKMLDTQWTAVDQGFPLHHTANEYWITSIPDCLNNSDVFDVTVDTSTRAVGCNISSEHTVDRSATGLSPLSYNHLDINFHPYSFSMNITPSHGVDLNTVFSADTYIYMADISQDQNMSFHLDGNITALGYDGSQVRNFVDGCYAKDINLTINTSGASSTLAHQYRFNNGVKSDLNTANNIIDLNTTNFTLANQGSTGTSIQINFDRNKTSVMNPEKVLFSTYTSNCADAAECTMDVNLTTATTNGTFNVDRNITHYYGKAHASRQRYEVPTDAPNANIYYQIYCFGTINGNTCVPSLLPSLQRTDDIRWYVNSSHNIINDGNVSTVLQKAGSNTVTASNLINNTTTTVDLSYDATKGYPYKTTMEITPSNWLIYNKDDSSALVNEFSVEFEKASIGWSGVHETNTTTVDTATVKTNRRSMW